jgi:hypothetical protein
VNKGLIGQINPDCYYVQIAIHWEGRKTTKPKELVIVNTYFCAIVERNGRANPTGKTLAKHAYWAEFHCPREFITAARVGALGLCTHFTTRLSAAIRNEKNTVRTPSSGNLALQRLASCCPVARAIACCVTLPRWTVFRNKIPFAGLLRCDALTSSLGDAAVRRSRP